MENILFLHEAVWYDQVLKQDIHAIHENSTEICTWGTVIIGIEVNGKD